MITIIVDEAYAFDYLSILEIKQLFNKTINSSYITNLITHFKDQIGNNLFNQIYSSKEYLNMKEINLETFKLVDMAKNNQCSAKEIDFCNYKRFLAKKELQNKFFKNSTQELKIGYQQYEK
jgi:hypothetical protein